MHIDHEPEIFHDGEKLDSYVTEDCSMETLDIQWMSCTCGRLRCRFLFYNSLELISSH